MNRWNAANRITLRLLPACYKIFPESINIERYFLKFGRMPNIVTPKRLSEKVLCKMLFDRNPNLTLYTDKFLVREFVRSRLGDDQSLPTLYATALSSSEIQHLSLPSQFVMKPNHASGLVRIVRDSTSLQQGELESLAASWLRLNYFDSYQEWAYKDIKPRILLEELLNPDGGQLDNYTFHCFGGEPRFLRIDRAKVPPMNTHCNVYDMNLSMLPVRDLARPEHFGLDVKKILNFDKMIEIARKLSLGSDFIRVDLYNIEGRIAFGELTNYPDNALTKYDPPEWDIEFGRFWK